MSSPPFRVNLKPFAGPLEFLLSLLSMEAMTPRELTLREMVDQYEVYLNTLEQPSLETVAEELVQLLRVAYLKSHSLLPLPTTLEEEPTLALLQEKLKELGLYSTLGELLSLRPLLHWDRFPRGMHENPPPPWIPLIPPQELISALRRIYERSYLSPMHFTLEPRPTLEEELPELWALLKSGEELTLPELIPPQLPRLRKVFRFLLLLELIRQEGAELLDGEGTFRIRGKNLTQELYVRMIPEASSGHAG